MKKYICVHGHFYQPPREDPWTGQIADQPSAAPYKNWNERIDKECYTANTKAPILNDKGEITACINNYENISFDIGPTLLPWLKLHNPLTYKAILEADRASAKKNNGHGNAMAQIYNHMIMPLASRRDKWTQVAWGIADFEFHYGRKPEGMWLSETAADKETLKILAEQGILYSVLAPHQAKRVRRLGFAKPWMTLRNEKVDTKRAYRVLLDRGKQFCVFFYDAPISQAVAFGGLLHNGDQMNLQFLNNFDQSENAQLVSSATDGESFGHHHLLGEMAIAYGLSKIQEQGLAKITNYANYLKEFGSAWEVDVHENTSWSCSHGIGRWKEDCGCRINSSDGWNQKWRTPLREAFDYLKKNIDQSFERTLNEFIKDPWKARNEYVQILLHPSEENRKNFISRFAKRALNEEEQVLLWQMMEAQKFALFMYTSCGWFFDDISGIEPMQNLKFACRAIQLLGEKLPKNVEPEFKKILSKAVSNISEMGTGKDIYEKLGKG